MAEKGLSIQSRAKTKPKHLAVINITHRQEEMKPKHLAVINKHTDKKK